MTVSCEEVQNVIDEIGTFSPKLQTVLMFLLETSMDTIKEVKEAKENIEKVDKHVKKECADLKAAVTDEVHCRVEDVDRMELVLREEHTRFRNEFEEVCVRLRIENDDLAKETQVIRKRLDRDRRELQDYVRKDGDILNRKLAVSPKPTFDRSNLSRDRGLRCQSLGPRLNYESPQDPDTRRLAKIIEIDEETIKRAKMQLESQPLSGSSSNDNAVIKMFDRLRAENESRIVEIQELREAWSLEKQTRLRDVSDLKANLESGFNELSARLDKGLKVSETSIQHLEEDVQDLVKAQKNELSNKIDREYSDLKNELDSETSDLREKLHSMKKAIDTSLDESNESRMKDMQQLKSQIAKDKDEVSFRLESESKDLKEMFDKDIKEKTTAMRKDKDDRERDFRSLRDKIEMEKQDLLSILNRDREDFLRKFKEEHEQRRLEQTEMTERLEESQNTARLQFQDLMAKIQRETQAREAEAEDILKNLKDDRMANEEKMFKERQMFKEALEMESADLVRKIEKVNVERMRETADLQGKLMMLGKSASRHIDSLKHYVFRECQSLFDLATKPCSVVFNCYREEPYASGGEDYITFTGCSVNIGNAMNPKSGEFRCPESGLYMFVLTCCTCDKKKCLLAIRKNGKDVANIFDQDGDQNRGKTMLAQTVLLELCLEDIVQVYAYTSSGITDHKNSRYTQFIGFLMRTSVENMHDVVRRLGNTDIDNDESVACNSFLEELNCTPSLMRGSRRNSRKSATPTSSTLSRVRSGLSMPGSVSKSRAGSVAKDFYVAPEYRNGNLTVPQGYLGNGRLSSRASSAARDSDDGDESVATLTRNSRAASIQRDRRSVTPKILNGN